MTDAELSQCRHDGALLFSVVSRKVKLKRQGHNRVGLCPFHTEKTSSFTVFEDGHYHCFGCNKHGTVFDFIMQTERVDFPAAKERVAVERGIASAKPKNLNGNGAHQGEEWRPIMPPPAAPPEPDLTDCSPFEYIGPDGRLLFYQRRFEKAGGKRFAQLTYGTLTKSRRTVTGWHSKGPPQPYPLYRLDRLANAAPDSTVLVVEGEKACQAAERLFRDFVATTWLNGANSVHLTDWAPLNGVGALAGWMTR